MQQNWVLSIHVLTALVSITLFIIRGVSHFRSGVLIQQRWAKIVPHVNDTVLLLTAIWLALGLQQYPFTDAWLTAKLLALIAYILLGMTAFKWASTRRSQIIAWLLALVVFAYIISVAVTHQAGGIFAVVG